MGYGQTKTVRGKADMPHPQPFKIIVADKTDTGSVMDTERPVNPSSPYNPIASVWDTVTKGK